MIASLYFYMPKNTDTSNKFVFWSIQLKPVWEKEINQIIADFEKQNNIKVVWVDIPIQEAQKRTLASVLSSNPPDLVNLNPDFSLLLAQRGALRFFSPEETEIYEPTLVNLLKYQDKIYALPFYVTSAVTIYNKEIFENCTKEPFPDTYEKLYQLSPQLKKCSKIAPFAINLNENDTLARILNKYNVSDFKDEKQKNSAIEVYKMFDDMYAKEFLPKDVLTINHREMIEKYMSNQALSIVAGSNFIKTIKQNANDIYKKSDVTVQLTGKNGKYDASLMNLVIPKKSKNQTLALEFAKILTNKTHQLELAHLTNVLPANKYALKDNYFTKCSDDLVEKARCEAAKQIKNLNNITFGERNKKTINEQINNALEEILLNGIDINSKINSLSKEIQLLQNN